MLWQRSEFYSDLHTTTCASHWLFMRAAEIAAAAQQQQWRHVGLLYAHQSIGNPDHPSALAILLPGRLYDANTRVHSWVFIHLSRGL